MTNNLALTLLQDQLNEEQKERQDLEDLVVRQQDEIRELKNRLNYSDPRDSSSIQNIESFLNNYSSHKDEDILAVLKERNDFIQLVLDTSPNFLCVRDAEGTIKLVNKSFANILFNGEKEKIKQVKISDFHSKAEEKEEFHTTEKLVLEKGFEVKIQESFTDRTGNVIILQTIKKPLVTADGEIFVLGISTDITEQVHAKEKIQHQEELYRLLSENSSDIISLYDKDFNRLYISPAVHPILGYLPEDLEGTTPLDFIHPEDLNFVKQSVADLILEKKESYTLQFRYLRKDGTYVWVESNAEPVIGEDGKVEKFQTSTRDITDRKKAQLALKNSERKYKNLIKYSQAYIFTHDLQGNILSANPSFCMMIGISEENIIGKNLKNFVPVSFEKEADEYLRYFDANSLAAGVFQVLDNYQKHNYMLYDSFLVNESEANPYIICNAQDITDRTLAEKELKKANEIASESIRLRENFLANMSHEIRTPMQGIMGMADLLSKTALNEQQQGHLKIISQSADNLLVIINDILDFSKIKEGKLKIEQIAFDINEVLQSAHKMLELKAEEKGLIFHVNPIRMNSPLVGDPHRLNQILLNLINNAIKFTEEGSIVVSGNVIEETSDEAIIEFHIEDTGIGIAKESQEKIFEEFSQGSNFTSRKFGGTGLGLNISKKLLDMQNGHLWMESEVGIGSKFLFTLPFKKADNIDLCIDQENEEIDFNCLKNLRVLLAEDNQVNVIIAQTYLARWGVSVDVAYNGRKAVALAKKNAYDIILMDIQMPELSGSGATKIIREIEDRKKSDVPIIALTANVFKQDVEKYLSSGMNDFLSKPFSEKDLFLKIAKQFSMNPQNSKVTPKTHKECSITNGIIDVDALAVKFNLQVCDLNYLVSLTEGDPVFMKEMINLFLKQASEELQIINKAIEANGLVDVKKYAHKLKSSSSMVGAKDMSDLLKELENGDHSKRDLKQLFGDIKTVHDQVKDELNDILVEL